MKDVLSPKMVNLPVFPLGGEKAGTNDNEERMTSLQIAEITGKRHADVMKAIRRMELAWAKVAGGNFSLGSYKDENNQYRPCYSLTKEECLYIATKFNDEARAKLVRRWKELETKERGVQLPNFTDPAAAARAWASQFEKNQMLAMENQHQKEELAKASQEIVGLSATITQMQPKATYYDMILANKSTVKVTQISQDYGMSARAFNKKLAELKLQRKVGSQWILYAPYLDKGYVHSHPVEIIHNDGRKSIVYNTEFTQAGRIFLYEFLKKHGILPMIENEMTCEAHHTTA